jgi:regulatory protein
LAKHNCPEDLAEELLNRYSDVGLIDDKAFAKALVNTRRGLKKLAKSAIKRELLSAGVSENDFAEALDSLTNESELELAIELAEKRLRSVSNLPYEAQQRRVSAFLGRRGFSQGLISEAIRKARQQVN